MAQNTAPIFPKSPRFEVAATLTTANTNRDGTGTLETVWTSPAAEGSRLDHIRCCAVGSNVATVLRVFVYDPVATRYALIHERTLPAVTVSAATESTEHIIAIGEALQVNALVKVSLGTTVAGGWKCTGFGGDY